MRKILITGGAGFIGSNYLDFHLRKYPEDLIINLDKLTYAGNLENLREISEKKNYRFINGDMCDRNLLTDIFANYKIDTVINFAAESHVDRSIKDPKTFFETNIIGTANLCDAARCSWMVENSGNPERTHFHHISTDEVFGSLEPGDPPFTENTPYSPRSPYAASKASSDHIVRSYFHTFHLPVTISNCSNNFGPYQYPEKLIPLIILNAISGKPLPIYGDGKQIRDWLYVEDHCQAISSVLEKGVFGESYNFGGNNQPTNLEIILSICRILDQLLPNSPNFPHEKLITYVTDRPGHDRRYAMNISKAHVCLNWEPKETLATGMERTVHWYLSHDEWVQSIRKRSEFATWMENNYSNRQNHKENL